jgi:hypothetical protein
MYFRPLGLPRETGQEKRLGRAERPGVASQMRTQSTYQFE